MKKSMYILFLFLFTVATLFANQPTNMVYASSESMLSYPTKAYLLIDYNTGTVLEAENAEETYHVASIVKLMTTLLTLEALEEGKLQLDDMIVASQTASSMGGSQAFLDAGQSYSVNNLLKSVIVASANDSSVLLGEQLAGSEENFVKMMNDRAKKLGMNHTLYVNATGLPDANQYSTALDSAKLLKEVMKHKTYFSYSTIWMDTLKHPLDGRETELTNTNRLVRYYNGCDAGKTGFTDEAGYCLVASAQKGNMRLIAVTLGAGKSSERFEIVSDLLNFGFSNYKNAHLAEKDAEIEQKIKVKGAKCSTGKLTYDNDFYYITKRGAEGNFTVQLELPKQVKAPLQQGEIVGKAYMLLDNKVIGEVNVVLYETIKAQTLKDILEKVFQSF